MIKKFCKLFLLTIALFIGATVANAEEAEKTLVISHHAIAAEPIAFPDTAINSSVNFYVKQATNGRYIYCMVYGKKPPVTSITYTKGELVTDNGVNYILNQGRNATNDTEFFKYQTALWVYLVETNQMEGAHNDINRFIKSIDTNTDSLSKEIRTIVDNAKKAGANSTTHPTININDSNINFTLKDGYYVSDKITVDNSESDYQLILTNGPLSTKAEKYNGYFVLKVPASDVTKTTKIEFNVNNTKNIYESYLYKTSDSKYQVMAATYKTEVKAGDVGSVTLTIKEKEPVITKIIKVDADTNQALKGATLQLTNSNGKIIETWETNGKAKEFKDLAADTYTLTEVSAPEGYVKSTEKVTFKIDANGNLTDTSGNKLTQIVFANEKEPEPEPEKPEEPPVKVEIVTGVKISKQDITNKKELAGAKLVIKDYDGNVIKEFVSGNEPTYFELEPGIYTLSETKQPEGYILSTETVTFTVKEDGTIETVVMYNTPEGKEVVVENTASFKTIATTIIGLIATVCGAGLIFKKPKNLV